MIVIVFTLAIAHLLCINPMTSYEFVRQAPIAATQGDSAGSTDASGIPVKLELLDKIRGYRSGTIDNLRLRVVRPARVNEFTILEEGTEAIGRATITPPSRGQNGKIVLVAVSAIAVTGQQIGLFGYQVSTGTEGCIEPDCLRFLWEDGGPASMDPGLQFEVNVAQGTKLPTDTLRSYQNRQLDLINRKIKNCEIRLTMRLYQPFDSKMKGEKVFIDGNDIGRIEPGNVLSMVPTEGRHEIRVKQTSLSVELRECTPYGPPEEAIHTNACGCIQRGMAM